MASTGEDELAVEQTEGFKVGEKKTIDEYQQLGKAVATFIKKFLKMLETLELSYIKRRPLIWKTLDLHCPISMIINKRLHDISQTMGLRYGLHNPIPSGFAECCAGA